MQDDWNAAISFQINISADHFVKQYVLYVWIFQSLIDRLRLGENSARLRCGLFEIIRQAAADVGMFKGRHVLL